MITPMIIGATFGIGSILAFDSYKKYTQVKKMRARFEEIMQSDNNPLDDIVKKLEQDRRAMLRVKERFDIKEDSPYHEIINYCMDEIERLETRKDTVH